MGKIHDSLLSGTTGRTGKIVVTNLFGHEFTRMRPRRRNTPPTPNQALIQNRMSLAAAFMINYRDFACRYFGKRTGLKSPFNNAFANLLDAYEIDFENQTITLHEEAVMFAKGSLLTIVPTLLESTTPNTFTLEWTDNSGTTDDRQTDLLQILYADPDDNEAILLENVAQRASEAYTATLLPKYQGKTLHVWAAFRDPISNVVSNSTHLGTVVIE